REVGGGAGGADCLGGRALDRIGPLAAADRVKLLIGRLGGEALAAEPPGVDRARRLGEAAHQPELALLEGPRVVRVDLGPLLPDLLGDGGGRGLVPAPPPPPPGPPHFPDPLL